MLQANAQETEPEVVEEVGFGEAVEVEIENVVA